MRIKVHRTDLSGRIRRPYIKEAKKRKVGELRGNLGKGTKMKRSRRSWAHLHWKLKKKKKEKNALYKVVLSLPSSSSTCIQRSEWERVTEKTESQDPAVILARASFRCSTRTKGDVHWINPTTSTSTNYLWLLDMELEATERPVFISDILQARNDDESRRVTQWKMKPYLLDDIVAPLYACQRRR